MMDFTLRNPMLYKFSNLAKEQSYALRVLHGFTDNVIQKRRQEISANKNSNNTEGNGGLYDDVGIRKKRALLDILLNSTIDGKPLTDFDIREEVDTFMFEVFFKRFLSLCLFRNSDIENEAKFVIFHRVTIQQHLE